jgi:type II secretory pathway component PulJ
MKRVNPSRAIPIDRRRGVTLVEMLVTVAILIIIMTIIVQVFSAATSAVSGAQALQQIDDQFRRVDSLIRSDFEGVTARFTPPLDPVNNLGYFEYGENEFADSQGEDSDDYVRFTAKAPAGRMFTGRMCVANWVGPTANPITFNAAIQNPITVTSEYAEIIYFLRNGNLYRRVLLVNPDLQSSIITQPATFSANGVIFTPPAFSGDQISWQGLNDLSAHPDSTVNGFIKLNTLGDLTNRENRFAAPRFANDYYNIKAGAVGPPGDSVADDLNGDNIPDAYPTLYYNLIENQVSTALANRSLLFEPSDPSRPWASLSTMAFPYIFPGAYSVPQQLTSTINVASLQGVAGWIHSPTPAANVPSSGSPGTLTSFDSSPLQYLQALNHNQLDVGDNLPTGTNPQYSGSSSLTYNQTWWGFPTWREMLWWKWTDPTIPINWNTQTVAGATTYNQPNGLVPISHFAAQNGATTVDGASNNLLPPMAFVSSLAGNFTMGSSYPFSVFRPSSQLFCDGFGYNSYFWDDYSGNPSVWSLSWEDDLIMTNVRSFDIKAYDNLYGGFVDLGWGDDARITGSASYLGIGGTPIPATTTWNLNTVNTLTGTFAHEGRMPPMVEDGVFDAQFGGTTYAGYSGYTGNVGDDSTGTIRLRRVWDSWSTEYSRAPAIGVNPGTFFPAGPPYSPPIYPSYPAPYQAPLRGIQIQIRATDPANQRVKSITIRQDFTDKL